LETGALPIRATDLFFFVIICVPTFGGVQKNSNLSDSKNLHPFTIKNLFIQKNISLLGNRRTSQDPARSDEIRTLTWKLSWHNQYENFALSYEKKFTLCYRVSLCIVCLSQNGQNFLYATLSGCVLLFLVRV
jgi:hypothetical protein